MTINLNKDGMGLFGIGALIALPIAAVAYVGYKAYKAVTEENDKKKKEMEEFEALKTEKLKPYKDFSETIRGNVFNNSNFTAEEACLIVDYFFDIYASTKCLKLEEKTKLDSKITRLEEVASAIKDERINQLKVYAFDEKRKKDEAMELQKKKDELEKEALEASRKAEAQRRILDTVTNSVGYVTRALGTTRTNRY